MFAVLPSTWKYDPPGGVDILLRKAGQNACEAVRNALSGGERNFLFCTDGAADRVCWLVATDHISLFGDGPLTGRNRDDLGPRFTSLEGLYAAPKGCWEFGVVCRVPDWKAATPAELHFTGVSALVSNGVDEAIVAGHGGGRVTLLVRCHDWEGAMPEIPPLEMLVQAIREGTDMLFEHNEGGEE